MKLLMAVDGSENSRRAVELGARLRFPEATYELVNIMERLAPIVYSEVPSSPDLITQLIKDQESLGHEALKAAKDELRKTVGDSNLTPTTILKEGFIANELVDLAKTRQADLIAVGSSEKGPISGALYGSVGRKLTITSPCSILVAKRKTSQKELLSAVIATDHSEYANRCIDWLVAHAPKGIGKLTVMTSYPVNVTKAIALSATSLAGKTSDWIEQGLERENQGVLSKFSKNSYTLASMVLAAEPTEAIEQAMAATGADLLILGAQGHGFMDRLIVGSVSFHEAVEGKYNTLILRV